MSGGVMDRARVQQWALATGRVAWWVAKSAATFLSLGIAGSLSFIVMVVCYVGIVARDATLLRLATHFPGHPELLDPENTRSMALIVGAICLFALIECAKNLRWWFYVTFRAPKEP